MITKITSRTFWDAEKALHKRNFQQKEKRIRGEVEKQLREQLKSVRAGTMRRADVKAIVTIDGMFFLRNYEKKLNKRGFVAIRHGEYDSEKNTQTFYVILKDFASYYPDSSFSFGE